jgi:tetratricopeptide (TPR) repeat protein
VAVQLKAGNILLATGAFEDAKTRANGVLKLDPKNAEAQVLLGNALAGLKDLDGALDEYQRAIALDPTQDSAYLSVGAIQLVRRNTAEAEASFKKAVQAAPDSVPARMALANFLWASGRASEAERTLKEILAREPANLDVNRVLGLFYLASNRRAEAEPFFKKIAETAKTPQAFIALADYYALGRRFDDATKVLRDLAKNDETYATATLRLAAIEAAQGQRAAALATLREVLAKHPKDSAARLLSARLLLLEGKRDDALAQAQAIVADDANSSEANEANLLIGRIQTSLDRTDEAIRAYEQVLKQQARPIAAHLGLAGLYLDSGAFDKASTAVQNARAIDAGNPAARAMSVRVLLGQREITRARGELASLRKEFPNSPTVLSLAGTLQYLDHQVDAARSSFTRARALAPYDLQALAGVVGIALTTGRTKEAVAEIEAGLKTMEPSGALLMLAAQTYIAAKNPARAEEVLKKAIDVEPARLKAYEQLGRLYADQKRLDDAIEQFRRIVERHPESTSAHTMLGILFEAQRRLPEAQQHYQKAVAFDSRAAVAANNLAWLYVSKNQNLDEALRLAQSALQQRPDDARVNDTLGWVYYRMRLTAPAIRHLEASVQKDPSDPGAHYHLGMAYAQAGGVENAKKELQKAIAAKQEFEGLSEARQTLAQLGN